MRIILGFILCSSALLAQADSVFTKTEVYTGKVIWAMTYSLFLQIDTYDQMGIPTEKIDKLVLGNGEEIIGPGVPNRRYYRYLDTFVEFPSGTPDSLRANRPAPGTVSVMGKRAALEADNPALDISEQSPDVLDVDGNTYRTIKIGSQTWMAENLRVTHYRDGTPIPLLVQYKDWTSAQTGAMAAYDQKDPYGLLYNWYAVTDRGGLSPDGWHIPSDAEWTALEQTLGMNAFETQRTGAYRGNGVGGKLSGASEHWEHGALTEDHQFASTEFSALPGGFRGYLNGSFSGWGNSAFFWSSSAIHAGSAWYRSLNYKHSGVYRDHASKQVGLTVRCIKDLPEDDDKIYQAQGTEDDPEGHAPSVVNRTVSAKLWRGMTTEMARQSLGEAEKINRTEYNFTIYERWVYPQGRVLFFESGQLDSWEDESF
ncbi:MAG: fibrobacter succinogenes major paralogous domain-containing protein [Candidatus Marinimicrobia bacterium]|nr:fibrobacter succinogenes major paralogous domain-containing protein [Candidatus Neomarinimicrobiota bacterium]